MCLTEVLNEIFTKYQSRTNKERPYIVGIDGLSGAGKTTLVNKLESELKNKCNVVVVIHIDDHIVERNKRYNTGYEEWYEYYYLQWDVELLTEELFEKIYNNTKLILPYYEKSIDIHNNKTISIPSDCIILIEGIFLQRIEWKAYYDYTVFIDCPREVRYERVLKRDTYIGDREARLDKYKRRYWLGEKHYLETEKPTKNANKTFCVELSN